MDNNYQNSNDMNQNLSGSSGQKGLRGKSADEVKQTVKEAVGKGIAAVSGAVEGFADRIEQDHLPEVSRKAIEQVGETTRAFTDTTKSEFQQIKESVQGGGSGGSGSSGSGMMEGSGGSSSMQDSSLESSLGGSSGSEEESSSYRGESSGRSS
ncbi:MAG TPA: hypothetical protein VFH47_02795 [Candidatus Thermoplasmatota archaeon]|nr:hypothetical protein [Candidatus Thermoplasmatota archaeon]